MALGFIAAVLAIGVAWWLLRTGRSRRFGCADNRHPHGIGMGTSLTVADLEVE